MAKNVSKKKSPKKPAELGTRRSAAKDKEFERILAEIHKRFGRALKKLAE